MVVAVAALRRIAEGQQEPLVAARQVLQAHRTRCGEPQRLAREVLGLAGRLRRRLQHALAFEDVADAWQFHRRVGRRNRRLRAFARGGQGEIEQTMRVVVGRSQHLPARHVLEGGRDAALRHHAAGIERLRIAEARQGRAVGAQQEDRLDQIAARLLDGERGQRAVVAGALGHDAVDGETELLVDLVEREFGNIPIAAPLVGDQIERMGDGRFATLDRDVHDQASTAMPRGSATSCEPAANTTSTPQGNRL